VLAWLYWGNIIVQNKVAMGNKQIESIQKTSEETKQILLEQLEQIDSIHYSRLMQKYPLGYCLFAIEHKEIIIPYKSRLESEFEIIWNKAKVLELTAKKVRIQLPDIHDNISGIKIENNRTVIARRVGSIFGVFGGPRYRILTEVVANSEKGVIVALGFK